MTVSRRGLTVHGLGHDPGTVDVSLDGHRVWSTTLSRTFGAWRASWPAPLARYLDGTTTVAVRRAADGELLATREVRLGTGEGRVAVQDAKGRWLAMNKWNRLGPSLEGDTSGIQDRLLDSTDELVARLQAWGYQPYIVGGTLLGALRTGTLLPHDDDVDLAWICEEETSADIALASYAMERRLVEAGYVVVRHSQAHLQVTFFDPTGATDYYIDIFTGYHRGGAYHQPFALRGHLAREDLVPVRTVTVGGHDLPAPARPEAWLEFAYGPSWRVPDPSFRFLPPRATTRQFETSFGVYNRQRVYWEKAYGAIDARPASDDGEDDVERFCALLPPGSRVVDLGCGDGRLTDLLADAGHRVTGYDYSHEALRLARAASRSGAEFRYLNLNDQRAAIGVLLALLASGEDVWVFARDLAQALPAPGRAHVWTMLRALVTDRTAAYLALPTGRHPAREAQDPTTWHLALGSVKAELDRVRLGLTSVAHAERDVGGASRRTDSLLVTR